MANSARFSPLESAAIRGPFRHFGGRPDAYRSDRQRYFRAWRRAGTSAATTKSFFLKRSPSWRPHQYGPLEAGGKFIPVDTGFIVHNDRTYPNLVKLLAELGVETQPSDMSFAVTYRRSGFEYSSHGLNGFFAQRSNLLRRSTIFCWRRSCGSIAPRRNCSTPARRRRRHRRSDRRGPATMRSSPIATFTRWPRLSGRCRWERSGLSRLDAFALLREPWHARDQHELPMEGHPRRQQHATSRCWPSPSRTAFVQAPGSSRCAAQRWRHAELRGSSARWHFDHVVFACHGDQVLPLLDQANRRRARVDRRTLRPAAMWPFCTRMPRPASEPRPAWASWNYNLGPAAEDGATVTYHMNRLQSLPVKEDYCVTLNEGDAH